MNHLNINGRVFVKNITDSLFNPINGKTADGEFKVMKNGIRLYNQKGELFAYIATHDFAPFIVTAYLHNNKPRYMYALDTLTDEYFGFNMLSYSEQQKIIENAVDSM